MNFSDLTFGVELEIKTVRTMREVALALTAAGVETHEEFYNHSTRPHWKIVPDGSVHGGFEVVSPVLRGEAGLQALATVCATLETMGCKVDTQCGYHAHFGILGVLPVGTVKKTLLIYAKYEKLIDQMMPVSRRANNNAYCKSIVDTRGIDSFFRRVNGADTLDRLQDIVNPVDGWNHNGRRYRKVNLCSYWRHGTIEFRQHSGTVDAKKAVMWVRFLAEIILSAHTTPKIGKLKETLTNEERIAKMLKNRSREVREFYKARIEHFRAREAA